MLNSVIANNKQGIGSYVVSDEFIFRVPPNYERLFRMSMEGFRI